MPKKKEPLPKPVYPPIPDDWVFPDMLDDEGPVQSKFVQLSLEYPKWLPEVLNKYGKDELADAPEFDGSYFEKGKAPD